MNPEDTFLSVISQPQKHREHSVYSFYFKKKEPPTISKLCALRLYWIYWAEQN